MYSDSEILQVVLYILIAATTISLLTSAAGVLLHRRGHGQDRNSMKLFDAIAASRYAPLGLLPLQILSIAAVAALANSGETPVIMMAGTWIAALCVAFAGAATAATGLIGILIKKPKLAKYSIFTIYMGVYLILFSAAIIATMFSMHG